MLVDSHAHVDATVFAPDLPAVMARCRAAGVDRLLDIRSPFEEDRMDAVRAAAAAAGVAVHVAAGVHPHDAARFEASVAATLESWVPTLSAWGEVGLDYHYMHAPAAEQRRVFEAQVALARKHALPLVVHSREADQDTLHILADTGASEVGGVIHCFTGGAALAEGAVAMGFCVSFSGIVTFKNAAALRDVARAVPRDRLLVETDAPYLAPEPHRGKRNEPALVRRVVEVLAETRAEPFESLAAATSDNARRLFRWGGGDASGAA